MAKIKPRVKVPKKAAAGEIIEIKALISHPMHTGRAKDKKTDSTNHFTKATLSAFSLYLDLWRLFIYHPLLLAFVLFH